MLLPDPDGSIPQRRLGSILVSKGMVTEEQLEEALKTARRTKAAGRPHVKEIHGHVRVAGVNWGVAGVRQR